MDLRSIPVDFLVINDRCREQWPRVGTQKFPSETYPILKRNSNPNTIPIFNPNRNPKPNLNQNSNLHPNSNINSNTNSKPYPNPSTVFNNNLQWHLQQRKISTYQILLSLYHYKTTKLVLSLRQSHFVSQRQRSSKKEKKKCRVKVPQLLSSLSSSLS